MNDPQSFPVWVFALFPVFFAAVWLFVTGILATVGGWSELARRYRDPGDTLPGGVRPLSGSSVSLRRGWMPLPANYNRWSHSALRAPRWMK